MTLILIIIAGLSAFMLGVIAGLIQNRRRGANQGAAARGKKGQKTEPLSEEYRYFLSYDGSQQI